MKHLLYQSRVKTDIEELLFPYYIKFNEFTTMVIPRKRDIESVVLMQIFMLVGIMNRLRLKHIT